MYDAFYGNLFDDTFFNAITDRHAGQWNRLKLDGKKFFYAYQFLDFFAHFAN